MQRQVEETLHAAMIDTDAAAAVRTGLLVDALSATGVGSLKVATAVADHTALGGPGPRVLRSTGTTSAPARSTELSVVPEVDPEEKQREARREARRAAQEAVRAAKADRATALEDLAEQEKAVSDLQASTLQVNGEIDELRRRIDTLEDRLEKLDDEAETAGQDRDEAAEGVALAESALAEAQAELDRLTD